MKRMSFVPTKFNGEESIMCLDGLNAKDIIFKHNTREIFVDCDIVAEYRAEDLSKMPAKDIKELVLENDGEYKNKKTGIAFLLGL